MRPEQKMLKIILQNLLMVLLPFLHYNCAGEINTVIVNKEELLKFKNVYIIRKPESIDVSNRLTLTSYINNTTISIGGKIKYVKARGRTADYIKTEFEKRGYQVQDFHRREQMKPNSIIVLYTDVWKWDFVKYLFYLDILLYDPEVNKIIAHSTFISTPSTHKFHKPQKEVPKIIDDIFYTSKRIIQ